VTDGKLIWSVQSRGEGVVPAMVCGHGLVFTSSGYGTPTLRAIRPDGQGEVTSTHIASFPSSSVMRVNAAAM
jgi:hypothetical protein